MQAVVAPEPQLAQNVEEMTDDANDKPEIEQEQDAPDAPQTEEYDAPQPTEPEEVQEALNDNADSIPSNEEQTTEEPQTYVSDENPSNEKDELLSSDDTQQTEEKEKGPSVVDELLAGPPDDGAQQADDGTEEEPPPQVEQADTGEVKDAPPDAGQETSADTPADAPADTPVDTPADADNTYDENKKDPSPKPEKIAVEKQAKDTTQSKDEKTPKHEATYSDEVLPTETPVQKGSGGQDTPVIPLGHHNQDSVGVPDDIHNLRQSFGSPPEDSIQCVADKDDEVVPIKKKSRAQPPAIVVLEGFLEYESEANGWKRLYCKLYSDSQILYGETPDTTNDFIDMNKPSNVVLRQISSTEWGVESNGKRWKFRSTEEECRDWVETCARTCKIHIEALQIKVVDKSANREPSTDNATATPNDSKAGTPNDTTVNTKANAARKDDSNKQATNSNENTGCKCIVL